MLHCNSRSYAIILALALALTGCGSSDSSSDSGGQSEMDRLAAQLERENAAQELAAVEAQTQADIEAPPVVPEEPSAVTSNDMKQGSTLRGQGSYLSAVGAARFSAEHNMILNNVTHALNLYNAEHGNYPKSHEEFMKKIIEPNSIALPELEPGYEYMYDPADHQLKKQPIEGGEVEPLQ